MAGKEKDYVGRALRFREDCQDPERWSLVGLELMARAGYDPRSGITVTLDNPVAERVRSTGAFSGAMCRSCRRLIDTPDKADRCMLQSYVPRGSSLERQEIPLNGTVPEDESDGLFDAPRSVLGQQAKAVRAWAGSESWEASRDIIQAALLGPEGRHGTGWIPGKYLLNVRQRQAGVGGEDLDDALGRGRVLRRASRAHRIRRKAPRRVRDCRDGAVALGECVLHLLRAHSRDTRNVVD